MPEYVTKEAVKQAMRSQPRGILFTEWELDQVPTVDVVPVDEIRVDIMSLSLENQEAVLNVSICGNPNEVKLPFCKEVAEVVHACWIEEDSGEWYCSHCSEYAADGGFEQTKYCPNCGAKMYGGINK